MDQLVAALVGIAVVAVTKLGPHLVDLASAWLQRLRPTPAARSDGSSAST